MTTTAATWFYRPPEQRPFLIAERLRTSFWDQRLGNLWLETVRADAPLLMRGHLDEAAVELEWQPAQWLRATLAPGAETVAGSLTNMLRQPAALKYTDLNGAAVWEWWLQPEAAEKRWQAVQGRPGFGSPVRKPR